MESKVEKTMMPNRVYLNYQNIIDDLKEELKEGKLALNETVTVDRYHRPFKELVENDYYPIRIWYYNEMQMRMIYNAKCYDEDESELMQELKKEYEELETETIVVKDLLEELEKYKHYSKDATHKELY